MNGPIGKWDQEAATRLFLQEPGVAEEGILFLAAGDECVATATDKCFAETAIVTSTWSRLLRPTGDAA